MSLFNTKVEFIGSGKIKANVDTILFEDTYLTTTLAVAEAGHADESEEGVVGGIGHMPEHVQQHATHPKQPGSCASAQPQAPHAEGQTERREAETHETEAEVHAG